MLGGEFAKRLRALRAERGLSQRDLAERIHTRAPQVSRYESGSHLPNLETLAEIAEVLRVDLDYLIFGRSSDTPTDDTGVKDVRLLERIRELERLDRHFRETAIAMLDAIIVQGHQKALDKRLAGSIR